MSGQLRGQLRALAARCGAEIEHAHPRPHIQQLRRGHCARLLQIIAARLVQRREAGTRRGVVIKPGLTPGDRRQAELRQRELCALLRVSPEADVPRPVVGRGERIELRAEQLFHPQHKSFRQQGPHPQFKICLLYRISAQKESPNSNHQISVSQEKPPSMKRGDRSPKAIRGEFVKHFSPSHGLRRDSPLYQEGAFAGGHRPLQFILPLSISAKSPRFPTETGDSFIFSYCSAKIFSTAGGSSGREAMRAAAALTAPKPYSAKMNGTPAFAAASASPCVSPT